MRMNKLADALSASYYPDKDAVINALRRMDGGYTLRRKGTPIPAILKRRADGTTIRNKYTPHIPLDAVDYARTWKVLKCIRRIFQCSNDRAFMVMVRDAEKTYARHAKKEVRNG